MGLIGGRSIVSYTACSCCSCACTAPPQCGQVLAWAMMTWSGSGGRDLPPPARPTLASRRVPLGGLVGRFGLGVCEGGTLEWWASLRGSCGVASSAASRAFRRCTSVHKAVMRASFSTSDKRSSSGSLSMAPLSWSQRAAVKNFSEGVEQLREADAEAAIAEYEHRGQGRRGRRPQSWRYHAAHYRVVAETRRTRRTRRGRPAKTDPPPTESGYRLAVEVEALSNSEEDHGWTVLATTVSAETCADAAILQVYQEQNTTVEPGFRWIKNPAAISPVWLEKPERIAALAMLTVLGLLVYSIIQRQVRLYLRTHDQQLPGNKG